MNPLRLLPPDETAPPPASEVPSIATQLQRDRLQSRASRVSLTLFALHRRAQSYRASGKPVPRGLLRLLDEFEREGEALYRALATGADVDDSPAAQDETAALP